MHFINHLRMIDDVTVQHTYDKEIKMNKQEIRKAVLNKMENLSWLDVQGKSHETAQHLLHLEEYRKARTILVYLSIKKELNTETII